MDSLLKRDQFFPVFLRHQLGRASDNGDFTPAPGANESIGVFLYSGGGITTVARPGDAMPGGGTLVNARDTRGVTPATLPTAGLLDQLAAQNGLQNAVFTAVGYGLQNRLVGGGVPFFQDVNPVPRMFAFSSFHSLTSAFLRLSQNPSTGNGRTCFGDSGGPNFLNYNGARILVAITVTGDAVCRSTNVTYRLDIASARHFLAPYVALP